MGVLRERLKPQLQSAVTSVPPTTPLTSVLPQLIACDGAGSGDSPLAASDGGPGIGGCRSIYASRAGYIYVTASVVVLLSGCNRGCLVAVEACGARSFLRRGCRGSSPPHDYRRCRRLTSNPESKAPSVVGVVVTPAGVMIPTSLRLIVTLLGMCPD